MNLRRQRYLILGMAAEMSLPLTLHPGPRNLFLTYLCLEYNGSEPLSVGQIAKLMSFDRATVRDQLAKIPAEHLRPDVEGYQLSEEGIMQSWRMHQRYHRLMNPDFRPHLAAFLRKYWGKRRPLARWAQFATAVDQSFRRSGMLWPKAQILAVKAARPSSVGHTVSEISDLTGYSYKRCYAVLQQMMKDGEIRRDGDDYLLTARGLAVTMTQSVKVIRGLPASELGFLGKYLAFSMSSQSK